MGIGPFSGIPKPGSWPAAFLRPVRNGRLEIPRKPFTDCPVSFWGLVWPGVYLVEFYLPDNLDEKALYAFERAIGLYQPQDVQGILQDFIERRIFLAGLPDAGLFHGPERLSSGFGPEQPGSRE